MAKRGRPPKNTDSYYARNKERLQAYHREYYQRNRAHIREMRKTWPSQQWKPKRGTPPLTKVGLPSLRWGRKRGTSRQDKKAYMAVYDRLPGRMAQRRAAYQERGPRPRPGWTRELRIQVLQDQGGTCAICERLFAAAPHQDHDWTTGKRRGLLCASCNLMLGKSGDSPKVLRHAADYIDRYR